MAKTVKVAKHGELKDGEAKAVEVDSTRIALFYVGGKYYALADTCPHRGGPLSEGLVEGQHVRCPWHKWEFDLATGACLTDPEVQQPRYDVRVEGEDVIVELA
jgi:NAD(P)H-dependent nitrite reductase small subunit